MKPLAQLSADLSCGKASSRRLVEEALARIESPDGEGPRTFVRVFRGAALAAAEASDRLRSAGVVPSPLAGIPVSVKDLCDIAGVTTLAGSATRRQDRPAERDASVAARLRAAGAVIVGTTNMVEFALGGLGLNPHFGDCRNPWDRSADTKAGRVPGGSSSGAAVSVTDAMAAAALGTDTMGSVRIPAAFCGLVGFKPTAARVPREGIFPLSTTLDSVGPLARTVECCALMDAVFSAEPSTTLRAAPVAGLRLGIPRTVVMEALEEPVAKAFEKAVQKLADAGARIQEFEFRELREIADINRAGGLSVIESYALHRAVLETRGAGYDPRVLTRMKRGAAITAAEYFDVLRLRAELVTRGAQATRAYDAVIMPTVAVIAPLIEKYTATQEARLDPFGIAIRNTSVANYLDRCALTIPCQEAGSAPVGFMLMGERMADHRLLEIGAAVEAAIRPHEAA